MEQRTIRELNLFHPHPKLTLKFSKTGKTNCIIKQIKEKLVSNSFLPHVKTKQFFFILEWK